MIALHTFILSDSPQLEKNYLSNTPRTDQFMSTEQMEPISKNWMQWEQNADCDTFQVKWSHNSNRQSSISFWCSKKFG